MNALTRLFRLEFPLFQSGMGGIAGSNLAASVANCGCGGIVALYKNASTEVRRLLNETVSLTIKPFGVNLIPEIVKDEFLLAEQIDPVLQFDHDIFFSFYGLPPRTVCKNLQESNAKFMVMVGNCNDAIKAIELGASAVILQGIEAGGHLLGEHSVAVLLSQYDLANCPVPLLVSGGIASGTDFYNVWQFGVQGCLCGSLFVAVDESLAHEHYKNRIVNETTTLITEDFEMGWPKRKHRVLPNPIIGANLKKNFIAQIKNAGINYPVVRYSAVVPTVDTDGDIEQMVMYAGQSISGIHKKQSAASVIKTFIAEFDQSVSKITPGCH